MFCVTLCQLNKVKADPEEDNDINEDYLKADNNRLNCICKRWQ